MDPCFSGEDLVIKARKPYTITKQREKWTEEEHNRFLEALKLYGRAWQRIEEHIGTKTAVQIRSHAQKFFTKLEKEGAVKGAGSALDIEIPPPRPKKKPTNPYPRKTGGAPVLQLRLKDGKPSDATSTSLSMVFVKETEDLSDDAKKQNSDHENEDVNLDMVAPCTSPTSTNSSIASEVSERSCTFRQFLPLVNGSRTQNGSAEEKNDSTVTMDLCVSPEESSQGEMVHDPNDEGSHHNCPRYVPVHILGNTHHPQSIPKQTGRVHGDRTVNTNTAASAATENGPRPGTPPPYLNGHPFFAPMVNPEECQSIMQMSTTFSSLILSTLAQNTAMYAAAASFASTLWPWFNPEAPSANSSGIPRPMNPNPSMVAMAGATVAAATAWWAANGLLPFFPQYHPGFAFSPSGTAAQMAGCQSGIINGEARGNSGDPTPQHRQPDAELFNAPNLASKPPTSLSSDSEEASEAERLDGGSSPTVEAEESDGSNKSKTKKQLDRSSSGSNTLSSTELEPDATMETNVKLNEEKHIKTKVHTEEHNAVLPTIDPSSRRNRSNSSLYDPWKEVSEEGRLAFQALFSREVLPQSFSPPHDLKTKVNKHCSMPVEDGDEPSILKLERNQGMENSSSFDIVKKHDTPPKTGFRLYKRCSMEAKESLPDEHKPKKLRL